MTYFLKIIKIIKNKIYDKPPMLGRWNIKNCNNEKTAIKAKVYDNK